MLYTDLTQQTNSLRKCKPIAAHRQTQLKTHTSPPPRLSLGEAENNPTYTFNKEAVSVFDK